MRVIAKSLQLTNEEYYEKHLSIINPLLPIQLTHMEIKVLGMFMSFNGDVAEKDRFGTTFRNQVKTKLHISTSGLSNYMSALKTKGAVKEGIAGILNVNSLLVPEIDEQEYKFKLTKRNEQANINI